MQPVSSPLNTFHSPRKETAYSGSPFLAGQPAVRFAAWRRAAEASGQTERLSVARTIGSLVRYTRHGGNRQMVKGYLYKYGVPAGIFMGSLALGPFAWAAGILGIPIVMLSQRRGNKVLANVNPEKLQGPYKHVEEISRIWNDTKIDKWETRQPKHFWDKLFKRRFRLEDIQPEMIQNIDGQFQGLQKSYNNLIESLFTEPIDTVGSTAERQVAKEQERVAKLITRLQLKGGWFNRRLQEMFHVNVIYQNKWQGKLIAGIRKIPFISSTPLLRTPLTATSYGLQALLTLLTHRRVTQLLQRAATKI